MDLVGHPRAAAAAGQRRRAAAAAGHRHRVARAALRRLGRRVLAARVRLRAGARARAGRPRRAGRSASTRPTALGLGSPEQLEPVLTAAGVVAVPIDWQTVELVWNDRSGYPVHPDLPRLPPPHGPRPAPVEQRGRRVRPGAGRARSRASTRATSSARCVARLDAYAAERGRPGLLTCALDTELLGHWWYEGQEWLRAVLEEAGARGARAGHGERRRRAGRAGGARAGRVDAGAAGKDLSTWDSPRGGRARLRGAPRRAAHGGGGRRGATSRARRSSAPRASCWRSSPATGRSRSRATWRPTTRWSGWRAHAAAHDAAIRLWQTPRAVPDPALRNLAPDLDLASLVAP